MTDDDQLELDLADKKVPWHWAHVKLTKFNNDCINWCGAAGLEYEQDFYIHIVDEVSDARLWPHSKLKMRYHYIFFKEPSNLTVFLLANV